MSLSAQMVAELMAAGVEGDALVAALRRIEDASHSQPSAGALRTRAYRKRLSLSSAEWQALREGVLMRDDHACQYCGNHAETVDHIIPLAANGSSEMDNLCACCAPCNSSKRDRPVSEWEARYAGK